MSDAVAGPEEAPAKSSKKPLILGLVLAMVGGGGGFYAASSGLLPFGNGADGQMDDADQSNGTKPMSMESKSMNAQGGAGESQEMSMAIGDIAYVEVDPITISLNASQSVKHLRFRAQLEVNAEFEDDVMAIVPRVTDVMNSYLRALELNDLTGPLALARLRAQILRRVQVVTGKGRVRDLLIMEFVLN